MKNIDLNILQSILKKYWGYDDFRPSQKPVIESVIAGVDTLALLPTGGGKSLCFQVPAVAYDGLTLVISPLIALMIDQVQNLNKLGVPAYAMHSGQSKSEQKEILDLSINGVVKLLYVSPERLLAKSFREILPKLPLKFLVIDEAHCISQFGLDFRPAYRSIPTVRTLFPEVKILAVTATATVDVRNDIVENLQFENGKILLNASRRDNLSYQVIATQDKNGFLLRYTSAHKDKTGVVYARNRKLVAKLSYFLKQRGISVDHYHAGLSSKQKAKVQQDWITGKTKVIIATNAFGMGIDKSEVRYVLHYDVAPSIEDYVQEAGRAGRDGNLAEVAILLDKADIREKEIEIEKSYPSRTFIIQLYKLLCSYFSIPVGGKMNGLSNFSLGVFAQKYKVPILATYHGLKILERANMIFLSESFNSPSLLQVNKDAILALQERKLSHKVEQIIKVTLRQYDGIYFKKCKIDEHRIATRSDASVGEVRKLFQKLSENKIVSYMPSTDDPKVRILGARIPTDSVHIPTEILEVKKENALKKLKAFEQYIFTKNCRQQFIDAYFGFENTKSCKICDVCKSSFTTDKADQNYIKNKILGLIKSGKIELHDLLDNFDPSQKNTVISVLESMESEQILELINNTIVLNR